MIKIIKYFLQASVIYFFFIVIKLIGLTLSRKLFSYLFAKIGPLIKSEIIINNNLERFMGPFNDNLKKNIKIDMWSNYGKTFVEYLYLKKFKNNHTHIQIKNYLISCQDILQILN